MDETSIEQALNRAERAIAEGRTLKATGFRKAVEAVRRDRALADRYADRLAAIDRRAFERGVRARVPIGIGIAALTILTAIGVVAVLYATRVPLLLLVGLAALLLGTHSLTHWIVGRALGIRFTHVFLGGPPPPRPGVKTDVATYLRASSRARIVMHASGAVVTKIVPFALLPVALKLFNSRPWITWLLAALGIVQIVTDITLSTKVSDWMKVRRELRASGG